MNLLFRRVCGATAALVMCTASIASADFTANTANQCGGNGLTTCASVDLKWDTGTQTATLTVTNLGANGVTGAYNTVFDAIGLTNLPAGYSVQGVKWSYDGGQTWTNWDPNGGNKQAWNLNSSNTLSGSAFTDLITEMDAKNPGPKNGLLVGQSITFAFDLNGLTGGYNTSVGVGIHGQAGDLTTCSIKIAWSGSGTVNQPTAGSASSCASTVPEPVTMSLVSTGLLGLGGFGLIKRRKKA